MVPRELLDRSVQLKENGNSNNDVQRLVCEAVGVPGTTRVDVERLSGGITNQLLLATLHLDNKKEIKVLVRAFGRGTDLFIDREREYAVHCVLQRLGLAPKLYARFANGLVYAFVPGRPTDYKELGEKDIMKAVAKKLAQWHSQLRIDEVKSLLPPGQHIGDLWQVLARWIKLCPPDVLDVDRNTLENELAWYRSRFGDQGGPTVMGHCDLLCGNILVAPEGQTVTDATFIDYEYAMPCPRAFDIANHFQEWQGYDCDRARIPEPCVTNPTMHEWCTYYLGEENQVNELVGELRRWWGMPGFYWGIWSAIQSTCSEIDFNYASYARQRYSEYVSWKKNIYPTLH